MNTAVGYHWIQEALGAPDFLGPHKARVASVNSIHRVTEGTLLVPTKLAPHPNLLAHALFAIKHEGVCLGLLAAALRQVPDAQMAQAFRSTPNGVYIRKLCHLWEVFHQRQITGLPAPGSSASYVTVFDPKHYLVGQSRRDARWRVDFNGLGDWLFCPVIRRTDGLTQLMHKNILTQVKAFAASIGKATLERALSWAYLSETEGSFAIEGEAPTENKAALFANLLKRAHEPRTLTEDYLVELQNAAINNPFDKAVEFRTKQNRLQGDVPGAAGVTYVPPKPDLSHELMMHLMALSNHKPADLDPLVHAAVVSFAFVFIHPFMDGNGRLSRFLIHHCLGQSGQLPPDFLLPISVAMKRHEDKYLHALTSFSKPARRLCQVRWAGDDQYSYEWVNGEDVWFRYMDLTSCVEFMIAMAETALDTYLRQEVDFLGLFDDVSRYINDRHDLRGSDLATLIITTFQNGGTLSANRRKRFADRVQAHVLDAVEIAVARRMAGKPLTDDDALSDG